MECDISSYKTAVDECLAGVLAGLSVTPVLKSASIYAVMPGGKRIRALLVLALVDDMGGDWEAAVPVASAMELLHCASLVHDDLPAIDNDDVRRGRPTCHRAFNEATAVLAGDFLVPLALQCARLANLPATKSLAVIDFLIRAFLELLDGQQRDIGIEKAESLETIHRLKTGALFRCCAECVSVLMNVNEDDSRRIAHFGELLGVAFQIADDLNDGDGLAGGGAEIANSLESMKLELVMLLREIVPAGRASPRTAAILATIF